MSKHAHGSSVSQHQFWESIYAAGEPGWDLKTPTPVFKDLLQTGEIQPGKICIPGAGLGYDAVLFAQHGFEVTTLEFATTAVKHQRRLADAADVELEIRAGDIFNLPRELMGVFDTIVEYVTLCAVTPERQAEFAKIMAGLLKPAGKYISLLFPIEDRAGGPPFGLNENEISNTFESAGLVLEAARIHPKTIKPRRGREKLLTFCKPV